MKYMRLFSYLLCFTISILCLIGMAKQVTLSGKLAKAQTNQANSTVEIVVERAYDRDMAAYGYKMIAILPEKETP